MGDRWLTSVLVKNIVFEKKMEFIINEVQLRALM